MGPARICVPSDCHTVAAIGSQCPHSMTEEISLFTGGLAAFLSGHLPLSCPCPRSFRDRFFYGSVARHLSRATQQMPRFLIALVLFLSPKGRPCSGDLVLTGTPVVTFSPHTGRGSDQRNCRSVRVVLQVASDESFVLALASIHTLTQWHTLVRSANPSEVSLEDLRQEPRTWMAYPVLGSRLLVPDSINPAD